MDRSDTITLISETIERDEYGVEHPVETERDIYCKVSSVSAQEFFEAGRNGLNPEFRMIVFAGDYCGERTLIYHGQRYGIYRAYLRSNDNMELYVERKGGTNGIA